VGYASGKDRVNRYATTYRLDPTKLTAVLSQFGSLPNYGQEQLMGCLILTHGRYKWNTNSQRVTFTEERKQLEAIEAITEKLLLQLGVNPRNAAPQSLWDQSERPPLEQLRTLGQQDKEKLGITMRLVTAKIDIAEEQLISAQIADTENRIASAVASLLFLHRQASAAALAARNRVSRGRGGSRNRPASKGQLIRDAIAIYAHLRRSFPNSGPKPGFGGPMVRFVVAVGSLCDAMLASAEIHDVWRLRKSFLKEA
jgi:hypothetical protein